jgi:cytochrome c oxidase subunit 4
MNDATAHETSAHPTVGHVVSPRILLAVWGALVFFTVVTVAVTWVDLGALNLVVAMVIAVVKGSLVALYFMHLRWDRPINGIVLVTALVLVMVFVVLALIDTQEYKPDLIPGHAPALER